VFDQNGIYVDTVSTIMGTSLPGGYTYNNNLVFSTAANFIFLPGSYNVYIFYRPTGGSWKQIHASGTFTYEHAAINFIYANSIEMYSSMVATPITFVQGKSASVNLNLVNKSSPTFYGQYQVNLYNLDGTFAETIGTVGETNGLPYNYSYSSPYLTFTNSNLASKAGTYLLAVMFKANTASTWSLVGSTNYQNPTKITVQSATLNPDVFEPNNTISTATNLPLTFTNNVASKNTQGSNIHIGTDYDYYKFVLPTGYNYSITARIDDSYNSGNGQTYTVDGLVSYSTDGTNWSDAFDDIISNNITVNGGGTVYFLVSPYFTGSTGTYLFEASITRVSTAGINELEISELINVFPNPAKDQINIDFNNFNGQIKNISLFNIQGKEIMTNIETSNSKLLKIFSGNLTEGFYLLHIETDKGILTKKVLIQQ
jgi:hypothetical protein